MPATVLSSGYIVVLKSWSLLSWILSAKDRHELTYLIPQRSRQTESSYEQSYRDRDTDKRDTQESEREERATLRERGGARQSWRDAEIGRHTERDRHGTL